jgi:hypothetical protein
VLLFDRFLSPNAAARFQQFLSPDDSSETDPSLFPAVTDYLLIF